jgi:hypothetical protein
MTRDYSALLGQLCSLAGVPAAEHALVVEQQALVMAELPVQFRLDEYSGFVKIYVGLGAPPPALLPTLCQRLLESQFSMPAPFSMLTALDAQSGRLALIGCMPLCREPEEMQACFDFLQACVQAALLMKQGMEEGWCGAEW